MRGSGGAAASRGAHSTMTAPVRLPAVDRATESVGMVPQLHFSLASFSSSWTSSLLFLHFTETGHSHSPERFAAANLGGTASSTDARQPPGPQEPLLPAPGSSGAGGSEDGDVFTVS